MKIGGVVIEKLKSDDGTLAILIGPWLFLVNFVNVLDRALYCDLGRGGVLDLVVKSKVEIELPPP